MAASLHTFNIISDFGFQPLTCLTFCLAKEINKPSLSNYMFDV